MVNHLVKWENPRAKQKDGFNGAKKKVQSLADSKKKKKKE